MPGSVHKCRILVVSRFRIWRCYLAKRQNEIRCTSAVLSTGVNWDSFSAFQLDYQNLRVNYANAVLDKLISWKFSLQNAS